MSEPRSSSVALCREQQEEGRSAAPGVGAHPWIAVSLLQTSDAAGSGEAVRGQQCGVRTQCSAMGSAHPYPHCSSGFLFCTAPCAGWGFSPHPTLCSPVHQNLRHRCEDAGCQVLPGEGHRPRLRPAGEAGGQADL